MKSIWACGLATLLLAGCAASPEAEFEKMCLEAIKETLKSPSSFQLVEFQFFEGEYEYPDENAVNERLDELKRIGDTREFTDQEWIEWSDLENDLYSITNQSGKAYRAFVDYDADNSFGASLRGRSSCSFNSPDGGAPRRTKDISVIEDT